MKKVTMCGTWMVIFFIQFASSNAYAKANFCARAFKGQPPQTIPYFPPLPKHEDLRPEYEDFVRDNYGYATEKIDWIETNKGPLPVVTKGKVKESAMRPQVQNIDKLKAQWDPEYPKMDVVVIGGGLAGLTSAFYAAKNEIKKILILEHKDRLGGIAMWNELAGVTFGVAGAYFTKPELFMRLIAKHIGLWDMLEKYEIPDHIDSYFWNKRLFMGWWEDVKVLEKMPADFAAFLYRLKKLDEKGEILIQPMEDAEKIDKYDNQTMLEWLKETPDYLKGLAESGDATAQVLYKNLTAPDKKRDPKNQWELMYDSLKNRLGMKNVQGVLEIYGRSAGGDHPNELNAAMFLNFYISEVGMRYTGPEGSGSVTKVLLKALEKFKNEIRSRTSATVASIKPLPDGNSLIYYQKDGKLYKVLAKKVVYASQLGLAPSIIEGFNKESAPKKIAALENLEYRHYIVINLHLQGHPLVEKTYDLWVRNDGEYSQEYITDIIDGRYMHFEGKPAKDRNDNRGVATIYLPLPKNMTFDHIGQKQILALSQKAIDQALRFINESNGPQGVKPVAAQINVWPNSIHIASKGHIKRMEAFNTPFKGIEFAHSNMGTPSVEEAMVRGYFAALRIYSQTSGIPYEKLIEDARLEIDSIQDTSDPHDPQPH